VVGLELADDKGRVIADAEIGWVDSKLVLLREDQEDMFAIWTEQGWTSLCLDGDLTMVSEKPWEEAAAKALGLTINNKE
jgi:DEAD/DEAH box helicase domain-containing protein